MRGANTDLQRHVQAQNFLEGAAANNANRDCEQVHACHHIEPCEFDR